MGLLNDLETRLEQEMPRRLQESLQRAWDDYRAPVCPLRFDDAPPPPAPASIITGYG